MLTWLTDQDVYFPILLLRIRGDLSTDMLLRFKCRNAKWSAQFEHRVDKDNKHTGWQSK